MADQVASRFKLAVETIDVAFTLLVRHSLSLSTLDILDMHRRILELQSGNEKLLQETLQLFKALAVEPRLFRFRLLAAALAHSLPRTCSSQATSEDIHVAASDLRQLANEAEFLSATSISAKLMAIVDVMLKQAQENLQDEKVH